MIEIHIKWVLVIVATIGFIIWLPLSTRSKGSGDYNFGAGLGAIVPIFFYLIFWVAWLLIFK